MFDRIFLAHPRCVGETYFEHAAAASVFAGRLFAAALACLIHAFVPVLFQRTGSRIVADLHSRMVTNRQRLPAVPNAFDYAI